MVNDMICGFLSPDGVLYSCPHYGHTSKAEQLITALNIKRTKPFDMCEDVLLKNGWICVRTSDVYKAIYDDDGEIVFITDEQKEFFAEHREEFSDMQLAYIEDLVRDFGKMQKRREQSGGADNV